MSVEPETTNSGFSLLEVIVAFVILSSALVVAAQTITLASRSLAVADEKEQAIEMIARLRASAPDDTISRISDGKGGVWHVAFRRSTDDSALAAGVSALTLTSPRGARYDFLLPPPAFDR